MKVFKHFKKCALSSDFNGSLLSIIEHKTIFNLQVKVKVVDTLHVEKFFFITTIIMKYFLIKSSFIHERAKSFAGSLCCKKMKICSSALYTCSLQIKMLSCDVKMNQISK